MTRPKVAELESMSAIDLLDKLIWDESNASCYRDRLAWLLAAEGSKSVAVFFNSNRPSPSTIQKPELVEYQTLLRDRKKPGCLTPFFQEILMSGWDYIDPKQDGRGMYTSPDEVVEFINDMINDDMSYPDMTEGQRGKADTISHAFSRWLQANRNHRRTTNE